MVVQQTIPAFTKGTHNLLPPEVIPKDAAKDSLNWATVDGHIELIRGRIAVGGFGAGGKNYGEHTGFKVDGTAVRFRKVNGNIQTLVGSTWTNVITGLSNKDVTFSNYSSLAGAFVYIFTKEGPYKIVTANPTSFATLYDSTKNFKGYGLIDKGRTYLWGRDEDPTGFYGSWIDNQSAVSGSTGVYTAVSGEATSSLGGTLAFKAGNPTRTAFGVTITLTVSGEVYTDNFNGVLTGSLGGTGTINYMTGVYTLSNAGVGTAAYQWENSNLRGVTDFSKSATRLAGEGFVVRQDIGGDAIQLALVLAGSVFSLKQRSAYKFTPDTTDLNPTNEVFRTDIGVSSLRSAVSTGLGIIYMNTANISKPRLEILSQNPLGDNFLTKVLCEQFAFSNYSYTDCLVDAWDRFIIVGCKTPIESENNRLLLCNILDKTVGATYYGIRSSAKVNGVLYGGDPVSQTTYELFSGFDDNGQSLQNFWESKDEIFGSNVLKKIKKEILQGSIDPGQTLQVYLSFDDGDYSLIGVIKGSGDYVGYQPSNAIGTVGIGTTTLGGGSEVPIYDFLLEIKYKCPKFRKRTIKIVATAIGFASVNQITDFDIWTYQEKLPARYRQKQNVNPSTGTTNNPNPIY